MGQYGNQPDFGTIVVDGDKVGSDLFPPSAIYVGKAIAAGAISIEILPAGNDDAITITGLQEGTFLPIVAVQFISCTNIIKENVLFYR
jgi:hypothetical protein